MEKVLYKFFVLLIFNMQLRRRDVEKCQEKEMIASNVTKQKNIEIMIRDYDTESPNTAGGMDNNP